MAERFSRDPDRVNFSLTQRGKEYNLRVAQRAQAVFTTLLNLLGSNYISTIQGPNYTIEVKAVAVELAKLELALEDVGFDGSFETTRSDFLYSIIGYLVFLNGRLPQTTFDDVEFKQFLLNVINIYFQGSLPGSMRDGVALFISDGVTITENFLLVRAGASGLDISDQFSFSIDIETLGGSGFPTDAFTHDSNIRLILDIIRPAHTLFRIRYIFRDEYNPNPDAGGKVLDAMRWKMSNYYYDDFRKFNEGIKDRDRLGVKVNQAVTGEPHSDDF